MRVSTAKQADRGFSLEAQSERIRAVAVIQGVELVDLIVNAGESAKSLARVTIPVDISSTITTVFVPKARTNKQLLLM